MAAHDEESFFEVTSASGDVFRARSVIMSIGPGGLPNVPSLLNEGKPGVVDGPGWCHTAAFLKEGYEFPPKEEIGLRRRLEEKKGGTLLVIGGG